MMKYSVVIPAHNAEKFLPSALESVRSQHRLPEAVIVVDDGSSDATARIAASYQCMVISHPIAKGPSAARNAGVAATSTELVAFLDADDEWRSDHAERLLVAFDSPDTVFCGSDAEIFGADSGLITAPIAAGEPIEVIDALLLENVIIQSTVIVRRNGFTAVGGYDESLSVSEDYDLWMRLSEYGKFYYVSEATVRRRMHASQLSQYNAVQFLRNGWLIRRRVLARRLSGASPERHAHVLETLKAAARRDVQYAISLGWLAFLRTVRDELERTDQEFALSGTLAALGGASSFKHRWSVSLQCAARVPLRLFGGVR